MHTLAELIEQAQTVEELNDEELAQLRADLRAAANEAASQEDPDDETLEQVEAAAVAVEAISAVQSTRETEAAERAERARAALERINAEVTEEGDEGEAEEATPEVEEVITEVEAVEEQQVEAIAADATPKVSRVAARRPKRAAPRPAAAASEPCLVASANAPGVTAGTRLMDEGLRASAFQSAFDATKGYRHGPPVQVSVGTSGRGVDEYAPERQLTRDEQSNSAKINAVTSKAAIMAAGGICVGAQIFYDVPSYGVAERPIRDALPNFGLPRGGATLQAVPLLDDVAGAVGIWTNANDIALNAPATKPYLTLTCPAPQTFTVDAITEAVKIGNFRQKFWPEQIDAIMQLVGVQQARVAENALLADIAAGSVAVTAGTDSEFGTTRTVLRELGRLASQMRSRHRLGKDFPLRVLLPAWLEDNMREDLAAETPGSSAERLATADALIQTFFAVRNLNVTEFLDGQAGQVSGAQAAGALQPWIGHAICYIFPEGTWLFGDGGELNVGLIRDSVLTLTNDALIFSETFEKAMKHGVESIRLDIDICPSGISQLPRQVDICTLGS